LLHIIMVMFMLFHNIWHKELNSFLEIHQRVTRKLVFILHLILSWIMLLKNGEINHYHSTITNFIWIIMYYDYIILFKYNNYPLRHGSRVRASPFSFAVFRQPQQFLITAGTYTSLRVSHICNQWACPSQRLHLNWQRVTPLLHILSLVVAPIM
jgi:hypothetical protein